MKLACFASFQPQPVTVDALAADEPNGVIAQGLSDGSIRLLDRQTMTVLWQIPGCKSRSVRRLVFYKSYLISSGVHGSASMWDLKRLTEVASVESSQGAIWDMALDGDKLYLATETGSVAVVELSDGDMRVASFLRSSTKSGSCRALSVCVEGGHVFVGNAMGTISRWTSGTCDATFSIPSKNDLPTLIWQLTTVSEGLIASGDSLGCVSLWDSNSCTLIQTRQDHQADILIMVRHGEDLFTSGVDARVAHYRITSNKLDYLSISALSGRDISALTISNSAMIAGGSDARLTISSLANKFGSEKLDRFHHAVCEVRSRRIFCQDGLSTIRIYSIAEGGEGKFLASVDNDEEIACFSANQEGSRLVLVGLSGTVRDLTIGESEISESKTDFKITGTATAVAVSDRFCVVAIAGQEILIKETNKKSKSVVFSPVVSRMVLSGTRVVCASGKHLHAFTIGPKPVVKSLELRQPITALSDVVGSRIVAGTGEGNACIIDIEKNELLFKRRTGGKLKFSHAHSIAISESSIAFFGEQYILTADWRDEEGIVSNFVHNSSVSTGGAVVGAGPLDPTSSAKKSKNSFSSPFLAIVANYKATASALIAPFERKQFQQ